MNRREFLWLGAASAMALSGIPASCNLREGLCGVSSVANCTAVLRGCLVDGVYAQSTGQWVIPIEDTGRTINVDGHPQKEEWDGITEVPYFNANPELQKAEGYWRAQVSSGYLYILSELTSTNTRKNTSFGFNFNDVHPEDNASDWTVFFYFGYGGWLTDKSLIGTLPTKNPQYVYKYRDQISVGYSTSGTFSHPSEHVNVECSIPIQMLKEEVRNPVTDVHFNTHIIGEPGGDDTLFGLEWPFYNPKGHLVFPYPIPETPKWLQPAAGAATLGIASYLLSKSKKNL